ncbi:MAG: hypothetical protein R2991_12315 [Thermoanaerobaculia bacterium]
MNGLAGLWRRWTGRPARPALFLHSEDYRVDIPGVTYDTRKGERILSFLLERRLIGRRHLESPEPASLHTLGLVHTDAYLESLDEPGALTRAFGHTVPEALQQRVLRAQRAAVAGTVSAARHATQSGVFAVNLGGGFHHALPDRAQGFCVFNDVAVAVRALRDRGWDEPVLVVDLDLHDGDGTRSVFAEDPSVFTLSIHNRHWSLAPAVASLALELPGEVSDEVYLDAVRSSLETVLEGFEPRLVVYLAGTDPAATDRIGNWRVSAAGMLSRDRIVIESVESRHGTLPWVVVLAGGYGGESWRYSARFLAGILSDWQPVEPPTTEEQTVARYRELLAGLREEQLVGEPPEALFELTEEDLALGPATTRRHRWLDALTPLGVELLFERTGFLDRLREAGFSGLAVTLDLDHPAGQTLRIRAAEAAEPLVELRLSPDKSDPPRSRPALDQWLLLQTHEPGSSCRDAAFRASSTRVSACSRLRDALLVTLAERLPPQLDGLSSSSPSQYHLAVKATGSSVSPLPRGHGLVRRPRAADRRHAAAGGHSEPSRRAASRRLRTRPIRWRPLPMISRERPPAGDAVRVEEKRDRITFPPSTTGNRLDRTRKSDPVPLFSVCGGAVVASRALDERIWSPALWDRSARSWSRAAARPSCGVDNVTRFGHQDAALGDDGPFEGGVDCTNLRQIQSVLERWEVDTVYPRLPPSAVAEQAPKWPGTSTWAACTGSSRRAASTSAPCSSPARSAPSAERAPKEETPQDSTLQRPTTMYGVTKVSGLSCSATTTTGASGLDTRGVRFPASSPMWRRPAAARPTTRRDLLRGRAPAARYICFLRPDSRLDIA